MDVKGLLEKYANTDEYAKKIFDKLLAQEERIENEKRVFLEWNKSFINHISKEEDLFNIYTLGCAVLLTILQCIVCESLGIVGLDITMITIFTIINLIISIGLWLLIVVKIGGEPKVDFTLISFEELSYLNDFLEDKGNIRIKKHGLLCKNNHYYIYDENHSHLEIVDKYVTDIDNKSIYSCQYYQIQKKRYSNKGTPNCNILEQSFEVIEKTFYSQKEIEELSSEGIK